MNLKHGTDKLPDIAAKLGIGRYRRHVMLCAGPDCCTPETGQAAWETLKRELKDQNLSLCAGPNECYRTRAACLRVCIHGPIIVVYPDGTWYHGMTAERIPRFVREHLIEGRPIAEWIFATNSLAGP